LDGEAPNYLLTILKANQSDASLVAVIAKALSSLASEGDLIASSKNVVVKLILFTASESIRKTIAQVVLQNNVELFLEILDTFGESESVVEPAITFFDQCFEFGILALAKSACF